MMSRDEELDLLIRAAQEYFEQVLENYDRVQDSLVKLEDALTKLAEIRKRP